MAGQGWLLGVRKIIAQVRADQHGINQIVKLGELVPEIDSGPFHIGEIRADDLCLHRPAAVLCGQAGDGDDRYYCKNNHRQHQLIADTSPERLCQFHHPFREHRSS
ncbi:hypothetical protein D3C75_1100580 [compost metagenome]